ncbi:MAG: hypothetical protein IJS22_03385 [Lachnospiraceae bacterium]|nr:hypothetical protein [Lachnospiraceae bacterium]
MKYIAVFDIPDDYGMGCAVAKIAPKGRDRYEEEDFENAYAQIVPLSEEKAEIFEKFNAVGRIMGNLGLANAYDMPSFWYNNAKDYKVIPTKYHQGYQQALLDVEKEVRKRFGFAEKDDEPVPCPPPKFE